MMKKRLLKKTALAMAVILGVSMGGMGTVLAGEADSTVSKEGRTEIVIWHMLSGVGEEAFPRMNIMLHQNFRETGMTALQNLRQRQRNLCRISIRL